MKPLFKILGIIAIFIIIFAVIKIVFVDGYSHTNKIFPELKPVGGLPQGFEWTFKEGPDFYIYNAIDKKDSLTRVGVYFGLHPDYHHDGYDTIISSSILGEKIDWHLDNIDNYYFATTLTTHSPGSKYLELKLHFWIKSNSEIKISEIINSLKSLQFELIE